MKRYIKSSDYSSLSEQNIIDIFGKSIWDMTMQEIRDNHLEDVWAELVDRNLDGYEDYNVRRTL